MFQILKFKEPIPSCFIYGLEFENNSWSYLYALSTPFLLTEENEKELMVYQYISDLKLSNSEKIHEKSINLKIKTLSEYLDLLEKQKIEDIKFRKNWLKKHPEASMNKIKLDNKNYNYKELQNLGISLISCNCYQDSDFTVFGFS